MIQIRRLTRDIWDRRQGVLEALPGPQLWGVPLHTLWHLLERLARMWGCPEDGPPPCDGFHRRHRGRPDIRPDALFILSSLFFFPCSSCLGRSGVLCSPSLLTFSGPTESSSFFARNLQKPSFNPYCDRHFGRFRESGHPRRWRLSVLRKREPKNLAKHEYKYTARLEAGSR